LLQQLLYGIAAWRLGNSHFSRVLPGRLPWPRSQHASMNPADFAGLYWYKLLIPCFTWGSILGTFLGPLLFPAAWFLFVAAFMIVFVVVSLFQVGHPPSYHATA
jgi:hypothetical protein